MRVVTFRPLDLVLGLTIGEVAEVSLPVLALPLLPLPVVVQAA